MHYALTTIFSEPLLIAQADEFIEKLQDFVDVSQAFAQQDLDLLSNLEQKQEIEETTTLLLYDQVIWLRPVEPYAMKKHGSGLFRFGLAKPVFFGTHRLHAGLDLEMYFTNSTLVYCFENRKFALSQQNNALFLPGLSISQAHEQVLKQTRNQQLKRIQLMRVDGADASKLYVVLEGRSKSSIDRTYMPVFPNKEAAAVYLEIDDANRVQDQVVFGDWIVKFF